MPHELDGLYQVNSTSSYQGPLEMKSDGTTSIVDGQTHRRDKANCLWTSSFSILNENEVEMVSVADPTDAAPDFSLLRPDGSPSRQPVTYKTILKLARKGDKIQMSGQIEYGGNVTFITMRRVDG
ncbi:MAG: hypothetical protein ACXW30_03875 [Micavibrio sp.]